MDDLNVLWEPYKMAELTGTPTQEEWDQIFERVVKFHIQYWDTPFIKKTPFAADESGVFKLSPLEQMMAGTAVELEPKWWAALEKYGKPIVPDILDLAKPFFEAMSKGTMPETRETLSAHVVRLVTSSEKMTRKTLAEEIGFVVELRATLTVDGELIGGDVTQEALERRLSRSLSDQTIDMLMQGSKSVGERVMRALALHTKVFGETAQRYLEGYVTDPNEATPEDSKYCVSSDAPTQTPTLPPTEGSDSDSGSGSSCGGNVVKMDMWNELGLVSKARPDLNPTAHNTLHQTTLPLTSVRPSFLPSFLPSFMRTLLYTYDDFNQHRVHRRHLEGP